MANYRNMTISDVFSETSFFGLRTNMTVCSDNNLKKIKTLRNLTVLGEILLDIITKLARLAWLI